MASDRNEDEAADPGVVRALRRIEHQELRQDVDRLEVRVDGHDDHISDLRERAGRTEGEMAHLVRAYERAATVATEQVRADLEVRRAGELARIEEQRALTSGKRKWRRALVLKGITVAMGIWAIVGPALLSRC